MLTLRSVARSALILGLTAGGCARQIADGPLYNPDAEGIDESAVDTAAPAKDAAPVEDTQAPLDTPAPEDTAGPSDDVPLPPDDFTTPDETAAPEDVPAPEDISTPDVPPPPDVPVMPDGGACPAGQSLCGGVCRALTSDALNCGTCGTICLGGIRATPTCTASRCTVACDMGYADCDAMPATGCETNLAASNAHCGMCGRACATGQSCVTGACRTMCGAGLLLCGGACVNPSTNTSHCGLCDHACAAGQTCAGGACMAAATRSPFQVTSLSATGCATVDHIDLTGDDCGGIALSNSNLFYTGDVSTGRFPISSLAGATALGRRVDGLLSNLHTGEVFTLAAGTTPLTRDGGAQTLNTLLELDGATGALTGRQVTLSAPIALNVVSYGSTVGVFSGYDRAIILSGTRAYNIDLPTGTVTDLGAMTVPASRATCETWAFWGVAEFFGGALYVDYVQSPTTVVRTRVPDGLTATLATFTNLSDMCSFTVSPSLSRWYFHHEYSAQFGGVSETAGYCNATLSTSGVTCMAGQIPCGAACVNAQTDNANCGACGNACTAGQSCTAGVCSVPLLHYTQGAPPSSVTFIDACAASGHATLIPNVDDNNAASSLPFAFRYWGTALSAGAAVNVASNGIINFDGTLTTGYGFYTLASTTTPNSVIAPLWVDLRTGGAGICVATTGAAPNRHYVVEWSGASYYSSGGTLTFEAVLNEGDNTIDFLYQTMSVARTGVSIGVESPSGSEAVGGCGSTLCGASSGTRIRFTPSP